MQCFSRAVSIALAAGCLAVLTWAGDARAQDTLTRAQLLEQGELLLAQQQYRRAVTVIRSALEGRGRVEVDLARVLAGERARLGREDPLEPVGLCLHDDDALRRQRGPWRGERPLLESKRRRNQKVLQVQK